MFYRPHERVTLDCGTHEITKQSHKDECDIHNILNQYRRTGVITHVSAAQPRYMELPSDMDYQQAVNTIIAAENAFAELPARVRDRFNNNPEAFLAAFGDPEQEAFLRESGLLEAKGTGDQPEPIQALADKAGAV